MTYQEGNAGDTVVYSPPSGTIGFQRIGQIFQGDGSFFYVDVFRQRPFSSINNPTVTLWMPVATGTVERFDPQYCRKVA